MPDTDSPQRIRPGQKVIAFRVTHKTYRAIRKRALEERRSPSELMRMWIERVVEESENAA